MAKRKKPAPVVKTPRLELGWVDDAGEWHSFPPLPDWDPGPLWEGEYVKVEGFGRRKAVRDPLALFRSVLGEAPPPKPGQPLPT